MKVLIMDEEIKSERLLKLSEIIEDMEGNIRAHHKNLPQVKIQSMSIKELIAYTHPLQREGYIERIEKTKLLNKNFELTNE